MSRFNFHPDPQVRAILQAKETREEHERAKEEDRKRKKKRKAKKG